MSLMLIRFWIISEREHKVQKKDCVFFPPQVRLVIFVIFLFKKSLQTVSCSAYFSKQAHEPAHGAHSGIAQ